MSDNSWDIKDPSSVILNALAKDCFDMNSHMPIEDICDILYLQYTYDEIRVMEAEFILQALKRMHPDKEMDSLFIEKLYAIPAILNNPVVLTMSLSSFFNAVCICNDIPAGMDVHDLPSRYLPRAVYAINRMLPDDMDFNETYLYTNVKAYIFNMYRKEDCPILDPCFSYLQREFNTAGNSISKRDKLDDFVDRVMTDCEEIYKLMETFREESRYIIIDPDFGSTGFPVKYRMQYSRLESAVLKNYENNAYETFMVKQHLSNMLYSSLYARMSARIEVKSDIWIICDNPSLKKGDSLLRTKIDRFLSEDSRNIVYILSPEELESLDALTRVHVVKTDPADTAEQIRTITGEHTPPDNIKISFMPDGLKAGFDSIKKEYTNAGSLFEIVD